MSLFRDQVKIAERVYNYYDSQNRITKNQKNFTNKEKDHMKYCTKCRKVWEDSKRIRSNLGNSIKWYDDFPSYGKPRETCVKCK
jgi:hypothetical protein